MGLVIGMDEAGYGPNLGPLVITATVWDVPGPPAETDFWDVFSEVVTQSPTRNDGRLHVADSKQVHSAARGLSNLERGVLAALALYDERPAGFRDLVEKRGLAPAAVHDVQSSTHAPAAGACPLFSNLDAEPWFAGTDLPLPVEPLATAGEPLTDRWRDCCEREGIRLRAVCSDVVLTERFNRLTRAHGSKGAALSRTSLQLLRRVWDPDDPQPVLVIADKHGGRNRYDLLLGEVLDGRMVFRLHESTPLSRYRVGTTELRFQTKAEAHLPVALASMVSKYIRELAMLLFNRFWSAHVPDLSPTKGYPLDARRFRQEIADAQVRLGISDETLWRER